MGKSNSIQEQQKKNQEFQNYVNDMEKDMDQRMSVLEEGIDKMQKAHYENFDDKALLIEGRYNHLTTISEWSLKSISAIIDSCSRALFGSKEPEGSAKTETEKEVSASIQAIKSREEYIANAAFDIVQSILGGFNDATSTSVEKQMEGKPIAPGMTLFIGVENNSFSSVKFFSAERIVQTIFTFKVYYSIKEGQAQSALSDLQVYEDQKEIFRRQIEEIGNKMETLDPLDDNYEAYLQKFGNRLELLNNRLEAISEKVKQLTKNKLQEELTACNKIVDKMKIRRLQLMTNKDNSKSTMEANVVGNNMVMFRVGGKAYCVSVSSSVDNRAVTANIYVGNTIGASVAHVQYTVSGAPRDAIENDIAQLVAGYAWSAEVLGKIGNSADYPRNQISITGTSGRLENITITLKNPVMFP